MKMQTFDDWLGSMYAFYPSNLKDCRTIWDTAARPRDQEIERLRSEVNELRLKVKMLTEDQPQQIEFHYQPEYELTSPDDENETATGGKGDG